MEFHDFMDRMRNPAAADLVRSIKSFIIDLSSRPSNPENDSKSVQEFLTSMEATFKEHSLWAGATAEELDSAAEGLEKYLMTKLHSRTFASVSEEVEHDQRLYEKMQLLQQFIRPELLDIPPKFQNESSWLLAQKEIQNINSYKCPREKLESILSCSKVIMNVCMATNENPSGADEFLPVLIYVLIKANPPQLYSNIMFIQRYRHHSRLVSEAAYYFTNLVSAESFIDNLDAASLSMDEKEFEAKMNLAREALNKMTSLPSGSNAEQVHAHVTDMSDAKAAISKNGSGSDSSSSSVYSVQKLQTMGSSAVVDAGRSGMLAREFPFMYASVGDLRIEDVESLLMDYKELVIKYYSLCKAVEKLSVEKPSNVRESKSVSTNTSWVDSHEHTSDVQIVSEKETCSEERVGRQQVPETDELKEPTETTSNVVTVLPTDDSSVEMADKNVILVNESSNNNFSIDVFQEPTTEAVSEQHNHPSELIHSSD